MKIWLKGERISVPEWTQQKTVRELFYYLLTEPRGASKEQIGLLFWPDSSPDLLNRQFKNAIYRLRRAVGSNTILYDPLSRRYSFNRQLDFRYDVEDFLSSLQQADKRNNLQERLQLLRTAIHLYRHPYAPLLDGVWAEPIRANLFLKFEHAALEVASEDLKQGESQDCLDTCLLLLAIDPAQELAWRLCMQAYALQKNHAGTTRAFRQCKRNLNKHLGIQPSAETKNLYQKLVKE
jgi:DNA-binding SARP family transcriptional activator